MSLKFPLANQRELAPEREAQLERVVHPSYGRFLEDFLPGQVFAHPRGLTVTEGLIEDFARTFMQANPLFLNREYAQAHGFPSTPASPQLVFNIVLSLGVQNNSEKAIANLGYYNAQFLRPVFAGDTLHSRSRVVNRRERGGKPGIVHVQTVGINQHEETVLQYERKILIPPRGAEQTAREGKLEELRFIWEEAPEVDLPLAMPPHPSGLTGEKTWFEDFQAGDIIVHPNGRTITDEHVFWTYRVGNTHPLHYDRIYSTGREGPMSGEPIVYGGLVFSWLEGLASRDISENALWELGFTEGYHTQPAFAGDTVSAISRVLATEPGPEGSHAGIITFQLIGLKNVSASAALHEFGQELFLKENDKRKQGKEKLEQKIFEIERRLLIKCRPV